MTDPIIEFLTARLDEDELWAREASRDGESSPLEYGVHWQWVDRESDKVVALDPTTMFYVDEERSGVSLRSVEEWRPSMRQRLLPQFAIPNAEEVPISVGGHILRHDPARVLAEVAAKRTILERVIPGVREDERKIEGEWGSGNRDLADHENSGLLLQLLAAPYSSHPDFKSEWRIDADH